MIFPPILIATLLLIIWIIVVGVVVWGCRYIITQISVIDPAFKQIANAVITVVGVIVVLILIVQFILAAVGGHPLTY